MLVAEILSCIEGSTMRQRTSSTVRRVGALVAAGLLIAACGGDDGGVVPAETTPAPPSDTGSPDTSAPDTQAPSSGAVGTLADVESAAIQIEAEGTFVDPVEGELLNAAGRGSGFFIDPSGIAVTNNHVVTGAALLKVFVPGEDQPRNAKVLGVSECSDLAVIDVDVEGVPFLEWYAGSIDTGLDIYAAGYPLGDPEYTLQEGIISKADADGETPWASIDRVLEHTAASLPGNSGGPIITADGQVVGVHYASNDAGQRFAIAGDLAQPIVEQLRAGQNVDSIGINGEAILGDGFSGIWVASVESGSPADESGIEPGDLLTRMEGLLLATDGTMSDYCDILRSNDPDDVLSIEVYRTGTDEVLKGQLNGDPLEVVTSLAAEVDTEDTGADDTGYTDYVTITDDSGLIQVSVPAEWNDVNGTPWTVEGTEVGPGVSASTDLAGFFETWGVPGVFVGASALLGITPDQYLDGVDYSGSCTYEGRQPYDDGLYVGSYDYYSGCGDSGATFIVVAAEPADGSFLVVVNVQALTQADLVAADEVFATFQVVGDLGG
jgi:serine protease Do